MAEAHSHRGPRVAALAGGGGQDDRRHRLLDRTGIGCPCYLVQQ